MLDDARDCFGLLTARMEGKYRVDSVVGEGGFGIVYRGTHEGFEAPVAIKCLKIPASFDAKAQEALIAQLREEGRVLLRLSQRTAGIVQALDVGTHITATGVRVPFLVLEWLDGRTIADDLRARRSRGEPGRRLTEALQLLEPAARALAVAHAERVAHRDVKPENLMIVGSGNSQTVKVLDFGIAKVLAEISSAQDAQTSAATPMLTPGYAAPEQYEKSRGASGPWSDVFALALVFMEVASGKRAIAPGELMEVFRATVDADRRPTLRALGCQAPTAVEQVLARALHVEPRSRYANAGELWDALEDALLTAARDLAESAPASDLGSLDTAEFQVRANLAQLSPAPAAALSGDVEARADHDNASAPTERATTRGPLVTAVPAAHAAPRGARPWIGLGVVASAALLAGGYLLFPRERPGELPAHGPTAAASATHAAPVPTDSPAVSSNPEAAALFREAVEAWRGGSPEVAVSTLERAVAMDRSLAAGHVRLSIWKLSRRPSEAREHYDSARRHAPALGQKDSGLLDAIAPLVAVPEDAAAYEQKLVALTALHPHDAELWALLAQVRLRRLHHPEALEATERALIADPEHVAAWVFSGEAQEGKGNLRARLAAYRACVKNVPRAVECLHKLVSLHGSLGQCSTMLADARSLALVAANAARAQRAMAIALHSTGAAREAVMDALERSWGLLSERERASAEPRDRASMAILDGNFAAALGFVERWRDANVKAPDQNAHLEPAIVALDIQRELGRHAEAAALAAGMRRRMAAWTEPTIGDWSMTLDRYRLFGNDMTAEHFSRAREEWSARIREKWQRGGRSTEGELAWALWVGGHGAIAVDEPSGRAAIDRLPPNVGSLSSGRYASIDVVVGRAYALAGDHEAARPSLERALGNCYFELSDPVAATSGWYYLGLAREGAGDRPGAIAAYERVIARWGGARPASMTANLARKRLGSLSR